MSFDELQRDWFVMLEKPWLRTWDHWSQNGCEQSSLSVCRGCLSRVVYRNSCWESWSSWVNKSKRPQSIGKALKGWTRTFLRDTPASWRPVFEEILFLLRISWCKIWEELPPKYRKSWRKRKQNWIVAFLCIISLWTSRFLALKFLGVISPILESSLSVEESKMELSPASVEIYFTTLGESLCWSTSESTTGTTTIPGHRWNGCGNET